jgi:hypothetical protein
MPIAEVLIYLPMTSYIEHAMGFVTLSLSKGDVRRGLSAC